MNLPPFFENLRRPLAFGLAVGILAAVGSLFQSDFYRSEAQVLPVEARGMGALGQFSTAAAALGLSLPGQDGADGNFVDILKSRWLIENLLGTEFSFHQKGWRFGDEKPYRQTLYKYLKAKNMDRAVAGARGLLSVSRDLKSKVLVISAETKSPDLSQQVVRKATSLLELFMMQKARTRGGDKALFAEARLKDARAEMAMAESSLRGFLAGNRNYLTSADPDVRLTGARLEAELKLRQQIIMTLAVSYEQSLMEQKNDVPILNVMDAGNLPVEKCRPSRAAIVLVWFVLAAGGAWLWLNRQWVIARLRANEEGGGA